MKNLLMKKLLFLTFFIFIPYSYLWAQTILESAVVSASGGRATSGSMTLIATIGQSSPPGMATSGGQLQLLSGFIYTLVDTITKPSDMSGPIIQPVQPTAQIVEGEAVAITSLVVDSSGVKNVFLNYRRGGEGNFQSIPMLLTGADQYQAAIPGNSVGSRGVEYYISAIDSVENPNREPQTSSISISVTISGQGTVAPAAQPSGSEQNSYRIISIPLNLTNKSPMAVLEDDLGKYDNTKWRFFNENKQEYPNTGNMEPGEGFWLIVKDAGKKIDSGPGTTNMLSAPFSSIILNPGWNLVGNPFNFDIPINKVFLKSSSSQPYLWSYAGQWIDSVETLKPFEGYAVESKSIDTLVVNPDLTSGSNNSINNRPKPLWSIQILAQSQEAKDNYNFATVITNAKNDKDAFDYPEPPPIGEYVSVYFPHQEWESIFSKYSSDARPETEKGMVWEFAVQTNIHDKVDLTFENLNSVPPEFEIWVADQNLNVATNLREKNAYEVAGPTEQNPKQLLLIVGDENFISENIGEILEIPDDYEVSQNFPNPFNPATTIRFGLPQPGEVTLKIYNILGQEVITLFDKEVKKAGYHTIVWDSRNQNGQKVASGIYIYHFRAGGFVKSRKMIIVK